MILSILPILLKWSDYDYFLNIGYPHCPFSLRISSPTPHSLHPTIPTHIIWVDLLDLQHLHRSVLPEAEAKDTERAAPAGAGTAATETVPVPIVLLLLVRPYIASANGQSTTTGAPAAGLVPYGRRPSISGRSSLSSARPAAAISVVVVSLLSRSSFLFPTPFASRHPLPNPCPLSSSASSLSNWTLKIYSRR